MVKEDDPRCGGPYLLLNTLRTTHIRQWPGEVPGHCVDDPRRVDGLQVADRDHTVVQAAVLDELLAVSGHDTLVRREAVRVQHGRGAEQRNVRSVEVSGVEDGVALEAHEDLAVREERIFVDLHLALDRADVHDADVDTFRCERVARTEVVELLEFRADVGGHDHPVGGTTERCPVDDVRDFEDLVHQGDVAVGEVHGRTSGGREVVVGTNGCRNDQVVDDFTIDFRDHFIGHQVGESGLGVDVVNRLEVLSCLEAPAGLELTRDRGDRVAVDAQRNFRLERVGFEVVLVVDACDRSGREDTGGERDLNSTGRVVELGGTSGGRVNRQVVGEVRAVANEDNVRGTVTVKADAETGDGFFAVRIGVGFGLEDLDHNRTGENRAVCQRRGNHRVTGDRGVFTTDFLRAVVRVECPSVLACEHLGGVLTHDLRSGDRLALGEGVAVSDVEDQARRLAHRLDTDEVVGDQLRIGLPDERKGKPGEVGDVRRGRLVFQDDRAVLGIPAVVLVLEDRGHQAELLLRDFATLAKDRRPFVHELVFLPLVNDGGLMEVGGFCDWPTTGSSAFSKSSATTATEALPLGVSGG